MASKGYCTLAGFGCDKDFLYRDRAFWLYVATWFIDCMQLLGCDKGFPGCNRVVFMLVLGHDKGFLSRDRASWLYVVTEPLGSMSRHGFPYVLTWFPVSSYRKCRNMAFLYCDRFGLG